ncbi:SRPBCC family protein [Rhodococcus sp. ACT016]|uniref:SRPBCC family protein n=1 Tax=Rhodococcus sp. ACT016 TaxID=3134808 RepID=UPI003D2C1219
MEYGRIERSVYVEATPDVVYEVVSSPEHLKEWWPDEVVDLEPIPGSVGELVWGDRTSPDGHVARITVVDAQPPRLFSFRWAHLTDGTAPVNSLLVTFELAPTGAGTTLRMTETGFREMGWEVAVLEEQYNAHVEGWARHLPRLAEYVSRLGADR